MADLALDERIPHFFSKGLLDLEEEDLKHIDHKILEDMGIQKPADRILILSRCQRAIPKPKNTIKDNEPTMS